MCIVYAVRLLEENNIKLFKKTLNLHFDNMRIIINFYNNNF